MTDRTFEPALFGGDADDASNDRATADAALKKQLQSAARKRRVGQFPYWLIAMIAILSWMAYLINANEKYHAAYKFIIPGLATTISATATSFGIAMVIGLIAGFGRISKSIIARNLSQLYVEFIRGVPILVLLFTISYVLVPQVASGLGFENSSVSFFVRATTGLAVIYGAYLAEVFRAGIESVAKGQVEAGRALGLGHGATLRLIVLPQAIRNMAPAIGNDLIAMLKDSSLLSVLAINELTQNARLYASSSFQFRPTYLVLTLLYATMTLVLSLLLRWYQSTLGLEQ